MKFTDIELAARLEASVMAFATSFTSKVLRIDIMKQFNC